MRKKNPENSILRAVPSVDALLKTEAAGHLKTDLGRAKLTALARTVIDELRRELSASSVNIKLQSDSENGLRNQLTRRAEQRLIELHGAEKNARVRRVINATGVVLHTNLGRAPLSLEARQAIADACGYCTLEYDTISGERGRRGGHAEDLLIDLTGADAALVVNNCAAAALLVLTTLARDGETIVSRGELVEIGGDFRVPDVMAQSGTRMIDVGTTNRTRLSDYRKAISSNTLLLMHVHPSNYRIVGFTKTPTLAELVELAHSSGLLLYEDAGSGALIDLAEHGITGEPVIRTSIEQGADVITFSGDKLLGGPQAGLIVGRRDLIERMRDHPLYRALRADKLRLAALEATLQIYAREESTLTREMIAAPLAEIMTRAKKLIRQITKSSNGIMLDIIDGKSAVGGGSAPTSMLPTALISVRSEDRGPDQIAQAFRNWKPPIIARILDDQLVIDLRTVAKDEEAEIVRALESFV